MEQKQRMQEMAQEFGEALKDTLDKMSARIALSPTTSLAVLEQVTHAGFQDTDPVMSYIESQNRGSQSHAQYNTNSIARTHERKMESKPILRTMSRR